MSAQRNSEVAANLFFEATRSATSCITREHVDLTLDTFAVDNTYTIFFHRPGSLHSASGGPSGLFLDVVLTFEVLIAKEKRERRIAIRMYEYRIVDYHQTELLVYHWQPGSCFAGPDVPHLHVSAALQAQIDAVSRLRIELDKLHLVTGMVSLQAMIRMLITEWKIAPLRHNWRDILARTEALSANDVHP
ncbi:MAG: hypothetical protein H0V24_17200 [Chloroflexia bacterium]|nr:hypothetical protein [Chloroflexia bacterium]